MAIKNLKVIRTHEQAVEKGRKGGLARTQAKKDAARINGINQKKGLTDEQKAHLIAMVRDGNLRGVFDGLLMELLNDKLDRREKLAVMDRIVRLLPQKVEMKNEISVIDQMKSLLEDKNK